MESTPEQVRGVRRYAIFLTVMAGVLLAGVAYALLKPDNGDTAVHEDTYTTKLNYQKSLNDSPDRFNPELDMIVKDGRAYMRTDNDLVTGHCETRCGTVTKVRGTYAVSLPVGYVHGSNVVPDPTSWEPVGSLTFWDQIDLQVETVTTDNGAVALPQTTRGYRHAADLAPGETAYTTADFVREDSTGKTYMVDGLLAYEMLGDDFGYTLDTTVMREWDGSLVVYLPIGKGPLQSDGTDDGTNTVPVTIVR